MTGPLPDRFADLVIAWQRRHGRHDLPWQGTRDPYRVWLSEIMLQQTQVSTVLDYYPRFLQRFPDVAALAQAPLDEVLALWSGLGYYSRARNLHRCAGEVMTRFGGRFPARAELLQSLPGIGRSTAAAIAAFCFGERAAILDGNVKRVLTRLLGHDADLAVAANERALWTQAEALLPAEPARDRMAPYTQGLMDLGATVCVVRQPLCERCPAHALCVARREGDPGRYPVKSRRLKRSSEALWLLWAVDEAGAVWLERRPTPGVWAGLFCLPVFDSREALDAAIPGIAEGLQPLEAFRHVLTHKDLHLHPVHGRVRPAMLAGRADGAWFAPGQWPALGLPAPVRRLLAGA